MFALKLVSIQKSWPKNVPIIVKHSTKGDTATEKDAFLKKTKSHLAGVIHDTANGSKKKSRITIYFCRCNYRIRELN
ncbi:hypothetical protein MCP1_190033 [Candidatus Terasakiella magnetica]|nr:hypothetical protein MCP1_190033 [Candidatus Terasakiella magnetica]